MGSHYAESFTGSLEYIPTSFYKNGRASGAYRRVVGKRADGTVGKHVFLGAGGSIVPGISRA